MGKPVSVIKMLHQTELTYFSAGAQHERILHGEFSRFRGYEDIASGVVLHDVDFENINQKFVGWISDVESYFSAVGASECRIYFKNGNSRVISSLLKGYTETSEVGLVGSLESTVVANTNFSGELKKIESEKEQALKLELYRQSIVGPDGHNMKHGKFAQFEYEKNKLGYMDSFLYWVKGQVVAAVSLAALNDFARLKNLLVAPEYRGRGVGREVVLQLMMKAKELGCSDLGVYAVKDTAAHRMYNRCGLSDAMIQYEYSKGLTGE